MIEDRLVRDNCEFGELVEQNERPFRQMKAVLEFQGKEALDHLYLKNI